MKNSRLNRRDFVLAAGSAGLGLAGAFAPAASVLRAEDVASSSGALTLDDPQLKQLALRALDAARSQGAQFADVRIAVERWLAFVFTSRGGFDRTLAVTSATLGVRAVVNGAWGFAGGHSLTSDNVTRVAQLAASRAKAGRPRAPRPFEFASAALVKDGRWETPIEVDPFNVAVGEQQALILGALAEINKVKGVRSFTGRVHWTKNERVFASTNGSFTAQRTCTARPELVVLASPPGDDTFHLELDVDTLLQGGYGYEALSKADLREASRKTAEEAVRLAAMPVKSVDVGRYDLILSPNVLAHALVDTIGRGLQLDRARGDLANESGTTYAMPAMDILGKYQLGSGLLTVTGNRSRRNANATVGWDEEGVRPEEFTLVKDGIVVDYVTTRATAPHLAQWYRAQGKDVRSHGCAARTGNQQPILQLPNLAIAPGPGGTSVDDLIKDVKRGFYVVQAKGSVDQQCLNAQFAVTHGYEIANGKLRGLVRDMAFQFSTPQFWKSMDALGGARSAELKPVVVDADRANYMTHAGVESVPARFRQMNVINTGKGA